MPIDARIPLGVQPVQFENPMNMLAKTMQIQGMQQEQAVNAMRMDESRRGIDETNRLNALYSSALGPDGKVDRTKLLTGAATGGLGSKIPGLQKGFHEEDKSQADLDEKRIGTVAKTIAAYRDQLVNVNNPQTAAQWLQAQYADPVAGKVMGKFMPLETAIQTIPSDPQGFDNWRKQQALGMTEYIKQNAPKTFVQDVGSHSNVVAVPGLGGAPQTLSTTPIAQSANNKATVDAAYANANATRAVASATRDAARISADAKNQRDTELKLQDDYRTESKGFAETSTAMKKVLSAIETADKNPGAALAAGTGFMKILDPTSVVRETELGMALNASGWFDRATNVANTLQHGRIMTAEQKKNLRQAAADLFEEAKKAQLEIDAAYKKRAADYKLDAGRIIVDRGQNTPGAAPPAVGGGLPKGWTVEVN